MKTLTYTIDINVPAETVFQKLTDHSVFPLWAKAWGEGMQSAGDWQPGSNIFFTDTSGSGTKVVIEEFVPDQVIKMKHIAMVENGNQEVTELDETMKKWIGSREDYFLESHEVGMTTFKVIGEIDEAFEGMMGAWPQALKYFKEICENK